MLDRKWHAVVQAITRTCAKCLIRTLADACATTSCVSACIQIRSYVIKHRYVCKHIYAANMWLSMLCLCSHVVFHCQNHLPTDDVGGRSWLRLAYNRTDFGSCRVAVSGDHGGFHVTGPYPCRRCASQHADGIDWRLNRLPAWVLICALTQTYQLKFPRMKEARVRSETLGVSRQVPMTQECNMCGCNRYSIHADQHKHDHIPN